MKRILLSVILALGFLISFKPAFATHAAGAELIYQLIPGTTNQYKFIYKFYRDCQGAASAPTSVTMCYSSFCGANGSLILSNYGTLPNGSTNGSPVGTGCPGFPTNCNGGTLPGYEEWWYTANFTIPTTCSLWKFSVAINARNNSILNLVNPGAQTLYVEALFDNTVSQNNSSPYFSNAPIPYCCINQPFSFNNGTIDPDGDSLYFESIQPRSSGLACPLTPANINYVVPAAPAPPFTPLNPFPTNLTYNVNASTGALNFSATATGAYVITIRVSEYRAGLFIGSVMRDLQIVVQNCTTPSPAYGIDSLTILGGQLVGGVIQGCATDTLNFCFDITSTSPIAILVPTSNAAVSVPGAVINYQNVLSDSIHACLSWSTTLLDTGLHILTVTVKDSSCTPPGILVSNTFSIPIYINPITVASNDTSICLGDSAQMNAGGGNTFHWTVLPGGSDSTSLSCTYCASPVALPTMTTSYVVTSDLVSVCARSKDTVTITVATGPALTITPDTVTCINANLQLNVTATPAGQPYNYTWSPALYLNNTNTSNPIVQLPLNATSYTVTVVPQGILACSSTAIVNVDVLKGYDITNNDTVICKGSTVSIQANGGNPKYTYNWSPATNVSNPSVLTPSITPTATGVFNYTVTASKTGCPDSSQSLKITVNPLPVISAGPDRELCIGDTIQLHSTVTPANALYTYNWTPASDLSNPTLTDPVFDGVATTMLQVIVADPIGCADTDLVLMTVNPSNFLIVNGDRSICPGDSTTLSVIGGVSYLWRPTLYVSDSTASAITVFPISTTQFNVYGYNAKGCLDSAFANVIVYPEAVVDAGDNQTIYPSEAAQLNASGNCSFFSWFPPNGLSAWNIKNPLAQPSVTTRYYVTAQTETGCSALDSVDVLISPESLLDLPNAFSPGAGTSINDELRIIIKGIVKLNTFRIFDRWGVEVFSTTDINKGWNGQYNGTPQPLGTYVYILDAATSAGKRFYKQGNITLMR